MAPTGRPLNSGAAAVLLQILLLSGLCSCIHHYSLINEPMKWRHARKYCRTMYTDLAMVLSEDNMDRLIAVAGNDYEGKVWLGLRDNYQKWIWDYQRPDFYKENELNFRNWSANQPAYTRRVPMLCTAFTDGFWEVISCTEELYFVCYKFGFYEMSYVFVRLRKTWDQAATHCKMFYWTGLVSIRNSAENELVRQKVPVGAKVFIGLYRKPWSSWSSGSATSFTYWGPEPEWPHPGNCVASVFNQNIRGQWAVTNCYKELDFMCYNYKETVYKILLKSAINLNEPTVSAGILSMIKEKLKDYGITRDYRLKLTKYPEVYQN